MLIYSRIVAIHAAAASRSIRLPVVRAIGRAIGPCLTEERAHLRSNLARVLPESSPAALNAAVGETFANFGACFVDRLTFNRREPDALPQYVASGDGKEDLARASRAPVVPAFCRMGQNGRSQITREPPIWVNAGGEEAGLATMVSVLERTIRAYPTQWVNFFDLRGVPRAAS